LSLDDYTNILGSSTATMPGGYLCNFLERTTRIALGSSKPGTAFNFEVKLNDDNSTYHIKSTSKPNASRQDAEIYFNNNIKGLLKSIV
ncbi:restriction endonuclease, partial [Acinetobacter baumannii]